MCQLCAQNLETYRGSLDNSLALASVMNRGVLIRFHTDWCNPCKDEFFEDQDLNSFIHRNFVVLDINPEDPTIYSYQKEFTLNGYPTFSFFTPEGFYLSKVEGLVSKQEFLEISNKIIKMISEDHVMTLLRSYDDRKSEKSYLQTLVKEIGGIHFAHIEDLMAYYIREVPVHEMVTDLDFIIDNLKYTNLSLLSMVIDQYEKPGGFFVSTDQRIRHEKSLNNIQQRISEMFDIVNANNDLVALQSLMQLNLQFSEKNFKFDINKKLATKEENDYHLLSYYEFNELKEEYLKLAERIIDRYIFHIKPADLKKSDESNRKGYSIEKKMVFHEISDYQNPKNEDDHLDSISLEIMRYPQSYTASANLFRIAKNCQEFYSLKEYAEEFKPKDREARLDWENRASRNRRVLSKAAYWTSMSYRYFSMSSYYILHASILMELGDTELTINVLKEGIKAAGPTDVLLEELNSQLNALLSESEVN